MTLAELEALRAALPDDDALPLSTTKADLAALQQRRADYDRRIAAAQKAAATLASLPVAPPTPWPDDVTDWRAQLCTELLEPIANPTPRDRARQRNLTLSIRCCDFGPGVFEHTDYDLVASRLGELMVASGYEVVGVQQGSNYRGALPWHGSLKDFERAARDSAKRRAEAEAALAEALLDDDVRAQREAEADKRRAELNAQPVRKTRGDGTQYLRYPDGRREEVEPVSS